MAFCPTQNKAHEGIGAAPSMLSLASVERTLSVGRLPFPDISCTTPHSGPRVLGIHYSPGGSEHVSLAEALTLQAV